MRICLMIEGQEDVGWAQWTALAAAAEDAGLEALFRSDHYRSVAGRPERGSLDAWSTLAALAATTERLRLGTLVSPASFRHPSVLAKAAVTADHVSSGRIELGMGAGWHEVEHHAYGFPFRDAATRLDVLAEQVEIVVRQQTEAAFDFAGEHYRMEDCRALPDPVQQPRIPLIIGGHGGSRSTGLAVRWADEYNSPFRSAAEARRLRDTLDAAAGRAGRRPPRLSIMTGCLLGADRGELRDRARRLMAWSDAEGSVDDWLEEISDAWVVGTPAEAGEQLSAYAAAGVDRVMLQHQLHDDPAMVGLMGRLV